MKPGVSPIMSGVLDLVETRVDGARTKRSGVSVRAVVSALQAGQTPDEVVEGLGVDSADLVAVLAFEALGPEGSEGPGLVQDPPAHSWVLRTLEEPVWDNRL